MEKPTNTTSRLNSAQLKAVNHIYGPLLVVAGAGTGKTHLLTQRIANILQKTDTLPQNILCLTYTDSAVHTMRERLSSLIGQSAYDVTISTYHSFGREIIQRYSEYFLDVLDQHAIDELAQDILLRQIQTKLSYSNPLKSEVFISDIKILIGEAKRALLSPKDFLKVVDTNQNFYRKVYPILRKVFKDYKRLDNKTAPLFMALSQKTSVHDNQTQKSLTESMAHFWQTSLQEAIVEWNNSGKTSGLTKWKNQWLAKDKDNNFIIAYENQTDRLIAFSQIYDLYEKAIKSQQAYDYDDMINNAVEAIEKNPDLRFTLQERYQFILLDEFQDTNTSQLRLIDLLTDNPVNEGRPNVMAVGDDDQAIYAFQGAKYSNLLSFAQLYKDTEIINLKLNYRSTDDILKLSNSISEQIEERVSAKLSGVNKQLLAATSILQTEVQRIDFKSDVAQYAWVARSIQHLIKSGIDANEIAVIAPQHRYLEPLVPYLHHIGVSVRYEKRENILLDPIIRSLISMAKLVLALAEKDSETSNNLWPEILSSDYWQIETQKIWQIAWLVDDQKTNFEKQLLKDKLGKPIALFFLKLANIIGREPLENILDYLIGISPLTIDAAKKIDFRPPFYDFYFSESAQAENSGIFWQLLSNLTVLRQHLKEYQSNHDGDLRLADFMNFIEAHIKANINIINTSPYYESINAVQLMTAHRAKGQEFTAVFVLGVCEEVWGNAQHNRHTSLSLPPNLDYIRFAGETNDEKLRLFYVALTRARQYLYLTSYRSTYANKILTSLKFMSEQTLPNGSIISPLLPKDGQQVIQNDLAAPELVSLTLYWQSRHLQATSDADLRSLLEPRLQHYQISPTHINQYVDVLNNGPRDFFLSSLLRFPKAKQPLAQYGSAIHESLHWLNAYYKDKHRLPSETQLLNKFTDLLETKHLPAVNFRHLKERGKDSLITYLSKKGQQINLNDRAEYNFRREGVFVGDAHLTGNIDKLIIDKPNKTITIVDYKTGRSRKTWSKDLVLHKYRQQLYFYKILVERSHSFAGYRVNGAYLEFVEPDNKGKIDELWLEFDELEQKQFEGLINGVWKRIMKLDFPDVSGYPSSLKGVESFEAQIISSDS